jgi:hypothetical protein
MLTLFLVLLLDDRLRRLEGCQVTSAGYSRISQILATRFPPKHPSQIVFFP